MINKIKKDTGKDIEIGIICQTDTDRFHKRVLITNYNWVASHAGFTIYKNKKVKKRTDGRREFIFNDIDKGESLKPKYDKLILDVKETLKMCNSVESNTIFSLGNFESPLLF